MAGLLTNPAAINAGGPAISMVTTNTRVRTASGTLGIQTDVPQFSGPMVTGAWIVGAMRCKVSGVPAINQSSTGQAASPAPATAPMNVTMGDARAKGS
jgi:hypothetical protein